MYRVNVYSIHIRTYSHEKSIVLSTHVLSFVLKEHKTVLRRIQSNSKGSYHIFYDTRLQLTVT